MFSAYFLLLKTALPATKTSAPALRHNRAVCGFIPPSTSNSTDRPAIIVFIRSIFFICESMKLCPPKPGLTVITSAKSILSKTYSSTSSDVAGFKETPALIPKDFMYCNSLSKCLSASAWTVIISAPASTNALI